MNKTKLNVNALGLAIGFTTGIPFLVMTVLNMWWGYANSYTGLLQDIFPFGYSISYAGAILGYIYGFVVGYLLGGAIALVYNRFNK